MARLVVEYIDPHDKAVAEMASRYSAQRLFTLVRDEIRYEDDALDRWKMPGETLAEMSGDCEDKATLLASLLIAKGMDAWVRVAAVPPEYVVGGGEFHAFVLVRQGSSWIYLDPSCSACVWGRVPYEGMEQPVLDFNDMFIVVHDPEKARKMVLR